MAKDDGKERALGARQDTVSFQLRRAQDASFRALAALTGSIGLRPGRYAVLQAIADHPGLSQIELADIVSRDKTTLTPILQDMQRTGLIERAADPDDRRSRRLNLTAAGLTMLDALQQHARQHDARLDAILGPDDKALLVRLLARISDDLA
jgi:DNA-binding MarR family transcriptional regulator